jgi:hypothetical protein
MPGVFIDSRIHAQEPAHPCADFPKEHSRGIFMTSVFIILAIAAASRRRKAD